MSSATHDYFCPCCDADVEMERFCGECKCWHCGRWIEAVHDCCYDHETGEGDCYDYAQEVEGP